MLKKSLTLHNLFSFLKLFLLVLDKGLAGAGFQKEALAGRGLVCRESFFGVRNLWNNGANYLVGGVLFVWRAV